MKVFRILIMLLLEFCLWGCNKELWEEQEIIINSAKINGVIFEKKQSYIPFWGPRDIQCFDFLEDNGIGYYTIDLRGAGITVVINFIIKCNRDEYVPYKRIYIKTPSDDPSLLRSFSGYNWHNVGIDCLPDDSDGVAVIYGLRNYPQDNPLGLSGYLEVYDSTDCYYKNRFELSSDIIPEINITEG